METVNDKKKFAVLGGDQRNIYLAKLLSEEGHSVNRYGFGRYDRELIPEAESLYEALYGADYIIGPIPCSHNGIELNAVYGEIPVAIDDVFRLIRPGRPFFAGHIGERVIEAAKKYEVNCVDILKREELALLNAIPTAEGAIKIAIENTDFTLHDSSIMVIGYGRVGKMLAKMLNGIGARVYPVVNNSQDEAAAKSYGYRAIRLKDMDAALGQMDVIFNTVPKILLDGKNIKFISKSCLIIDIASVPNGIDHHLAKEMGLKVLFTGSLPGITAPLSAARYIKETIFNLIDEA